MSLIAYKKLHLDYDVLETYSFGVELLGLEVKTLRKKIGSLDGGRVIIRGGEAFLVGAFIPPYQPGNTPASYDPYRTRKLLATHKELMRVSTLLEAKGLTLVPSMLYLKNGFVKCDVTLAKRKKKSDKRETLKKKESVRENRNALHGGAK